MLAYKTKIVLKEVKKCVTSEKIEKNALNRIKNSPQTV
jgi:hypothetical protein